MTKQIKSRGFTIVELLIVIVVIAILAAITIVAYNGIQQRAHTTAQKTSAENIAKKIESYNSINNAYPVYNSSTPTVTTLLSNDPTTSLGANLNLSNGAAVTSTNPDNTAEVDLCSSTASALATGTAASGYVIYVWDQTLNARNPVQAGGNMSITNNSGAVNTVNYTAPVVAASCTTVAK